MNSVTQDEFPSDEDELKIKIEKMNDKDRIKHGLDYIKNMMDKACEPFSKFSAMYILENDSPFDIIPLKEHYESLCALLFGDLYECKPFAYEVTIRCNKQKTLKSYQDEEDFYNCEYETEDEKLFKSCTFVL